MKDNYVFYVRVCTFGGIIGLFRQNIFKKCSIKHRRRKNEKLILVVVLVVIVVVLVFLYPPFLYTKLGNFVL